MMDSVATWAGSSCIFSWNKLQLQIAQANLKSARFALMTAVVELVLAEVATLLSFNSNCSQDQVQIQPIQVQHQLVQVALRTAEIATCSFWSCSFSWHKCNLTWLELHLQMARVATWAVLNETIAGSSCTYVGWSFTWAVISATSIQWSYNFKWHKLRLQSSV
jgi:hypothetical protein